ncbi:hypothetical protein At1D1609_05790 [Agrobacterium tumefaciens]|uniref:Uncharacterized protein n=3 Tax=Agrobacterium tumefaciens TaxID=358 RepID=A0A2L2L8I1_AGRTU|nr:hypothetical protein At1D1609_05790 [Agrobacterium tumefaciens]
MTEKPEMEDGFLITDRADEGVSPRYLVEHFVAGEVKGARTFNTNMQVAEALTEWRDTECIGYAMTEEEAMAFHDFIHARLFGWNVAISSNNPRGMCDGRFTSTKIGDRLLREVFLNETHWRDSVAALMAGTDPACLWPEPMRDFIRFCVEHRCPREINEPLSEEGQEKRTRMQGMPPWPEFIHQYDKPATLADMPELPPESDEFKARFGTRTSARASKKEA